MEKSAFLEESAGVSSNAWKKVLQNIILTVMVISFLSVVTHSAYAQVPQGFNYQALASNASGSPINNADLDVKISILSDTLGTVIVWEELHSQVHTNNHGVFSLVVGSGVRQPASSVENFMDIDWSTSVYYIQSQVYYQGSWKNMGSAKLWTVPYAMVAGELTGTLKKLGVKGTEASPDSALFEVKNLNGQTVFAVYNEGVRVYVDDGDKKGSKGGFAIGGFASAKAGLSQNLLTVSSDSVRIYVDETAAKGSKGGFAIGGFNLAKGTTNEFMFLTPDNYFIGHKSGQLINSGKYNSTLGYESGMNLTDGWNNIFFGYKSGHSNSIGSSNVFIGNNAGFTNTSGNYNIVLGRSAGYSNTTGWGNIILGDYAGSDNTIGYQNVFIGDLVGINNTEGFQNVFLGADAGYSNSSGSNNVFIGSETGSSNTTGSYNTFMGFESGKGNTTGQYNTFLGYQAGYSSGLSSYSTSIGYKAGYSLVDWQAGTYVGYEAGLNSTGRQNVFIGASTGNAFSTGADNVAIGAGAGSSADPTSLVATGSKNTFIGYYTGYNSATAGYNVIVGAQDPFGATHINGNYNVYLGVDAGNQSNTGSGNVFIGYSAGKNETGSNKLYISNSSTSSPLIWGDFSNSYLSLKGNVGVNRNVYSDVSLAVNPVGQHYGIWVDGGATNYALYLNGSAYSTTATWTGSDIRFKKDIAPLKNALNSVISLNGVNYYWKTEEFPDKGFTNTKQIGLIAQDVEKVLPELVNTGPDGYKAVEYTKLAPVLIEAVKEQQKQIDSQNSRIEQLEEMVESLQERIDNLQGK